MARMASSPAVSQADWLGACRAAVAGLREVLREHPTSRERVIETGTLGGGGDRTLVIDQQAEDIVFEQLERLHDAGARFTAVSDGPTMADVRFGYVFDLGPGEEWRAQLGGGALLDDEPVRPQPERRTRDGKLELVAIESADPRWLAASSEALCDVAHRLRA